MAIFHPDYHQRGLDMEQILRAKQNGYKDRRTVTVYKCMSCNEIYDKPKANNKVLTQCPKCKGPVKSTRIDD